MCYLIIITSQVAITFYHCHIHIGGALMTLAIVFSFAVLIGVSEQLTIWMIRKGKRDHLWIFFHKFFDGRRQFFVAEDLDQNQSH